MPVRLPSGKVISTSEAISTGQSGTVVKSRKTGGSSGSSTSQTGGVRRPLEDGGSITVTRSGQVTIRDAQGNLVERYQTTQEQASKFVSQEGSVIQEQVQRQRAISQARQEDSGVYAPLEDSGQISKDIYVRGQDGFIKTDQQLTPTAQRYFSGRLTPFEEETRARQQRGDVPIQNVQPGLFSTEKAQYVQRRIEQTPRTVTKTGILAKDYVKSTRYERFEGRIARKTTKKLLPQPFEEVLPKESFMKGGFLGTPPGGAGATPLEIFPYFRTKKQQQREKATGEFIYGYAKGIYTEVREKPVKTTAIIGGTALFGFVAPKVAPVVTKFVPKAIRTTGRTALPLIYGASKGFKFGKAETPQAKGEVLGQATVELTAFKVGGEIGRGLTSITTKPKVTVKTTGFGSKRYIENNRFVEKGVYKAEYTVKYGKTTKTAILKGESAVTGEPNIFKPQTFNLRGQSAFTITYGKTTVDGGSTLVGRASIKGDTSNLFKLEKSTIIGSTPLRSGSFSKAQRITTPKGLYSFRGASADFQFKPRTRVTSDKAIKGFSLSAIQEDLRFQAGKETIQYFKGVNIGVESKGASQVFKKYSLSNVQAPTIKGKAGKVALTKFKTEQQLKVSDIAKFKPTTDAGTFKAGGKAVSRVVQASPGFQRFKAGQLKISSLATESFLFPSISKTRQAPKIKSRLSESFKVSSFPTTKTFFDTKVSQIPTTKIGVAQRVTTGQTSKLIQTPITTTRLKTPTTTGLITGLGVPTIAPPIIPPITTPFFSLGGGGGRRRGRAGFKVKQPKGYKPSLTAETFGIRGKPSKAGQITGLGLRPIKI